MTALVGVIMGSRSDWETMRHACETLEALEVPFEQQVVSAHRTPDLLFEYAGSAEERGLQVLIAGAGGAAHLPGMAAAKTNLPVLGVPVESKTLKGMDSLLSIVQMPAGVPVGTLAIGRAGAVNAALLAAAIVARSDEGVRERLARYRAEQTESVLRESRPGLRDRRRHRRRPAGADARARGDPARALVPLPRSLAGRAGRGGGGAARRRLRRSGAARPARGRGRGGHLRVRERPRRGGRGGSGAIPGAAALEASQDRLVEKQLFRRLGIPTPKLDDEVEEFPAILKTRRLGYDGKGQRLVETWDGTGRRPCPGGACPVRPRAVADRRSRRPTATRASTRSSRTSTRTGSCGRRARRRANAPQAEAEEYATRLLDELGYVGVLALELFDVGGRLLANEFAPRVHNTGHWTIEGAATSQFENHLRAVLGLPLGSTESRPSLLVNLIGAVPPAADVLAVPGAHLHLYGKEPRPGRKLGHITLVEPTATGESELLALL